MSWASSRSCQALRTIVAANPDPKLVGEEVMEVIRDVVAKAEEVARNADNADVGADIASAIRKAILG